jgi:hypothetical protein
MFNLGVTQLLLIAALLMLVGGGCGLVPRR